MTKPLRCHIFVLFCLFPLWASAQEEFIEQPSKEITTISFRTFTGGVVVVKAQLNGHSDSLTFVLDTGSGGISLDSTTAEYLAEIPGKPESLIRGIGGVRSVGFLRNRSLLIGGITVDSLDFHVVDYSVLSSLYGEKIDGIIGYSLLSRYIVKLNYDKQEMSLWTNGSIKYPRGGYLFRPRISKLPVHTSIIKDAKSSTFNYLYDIGAGLTILFSKDYVDDSLFFKRKRHRYIKQGEGLGGRVEMELSVIKELKIGPYKFRNVPVNIFDDEYNITSYPLLGGIVGNDILRRFNCILNYDKHQIHLMPNNHFRDLFDYAYSGIELYLIDGKVIIGEIPKGSPAEKAGFKYNDEIIAINNRFGINLDDLKQMLQSTIGQVKVIINRNNELMMLKMKTINILTGK
ncbi:MAG: aspartyl protease family protein [Niabella sp.]